MTIFLHGDDFRIMQYFARFFENLQQDLKAFLYWCLFFTVFRIAFIWIYSSQLNGNYADVPMALFLGARLSLKTAGVICLIGFVLASLPNIIIKKWPAAKVRNIWHGLVLVFFSICFMARIPYYKIFNAAFNMMLINGVHDDIKAIVVTAIEEYQLLWRLPVAIALGIALAFGLKVALSKTKVVEFAQIKHKKVVMALTLPILVAFWLFVRFGGSFDYNNSINWLSAARLNSNLLNEAILDDGQALYRVRDIKKKQDTANNVNITSTELRNLIAATGGNQNASSLDEAFLRTVKQPKMQVQPKNVFLIIGESFGNWPFLPKFAHIGIVPKMQDLMNSEHGAFIPTMLPNGGNTVTAVNGLLTGLPETGVYTNYQPMSFKEKYAAGIANIMKRLGYRTVFWYGGYAGWEDVKKFAEAQGFDEFHCADEFGTDTDNVWGCDDAVLFKHTEEYLSKQQKNDKVFHMILTMSNHAPYIIDVDRLGFPREAVRAKLPVDISKDNNTLTELGHIWYGDKTMGEFVANAKQLLPDSLFVITGDHMERFTFAIEQDARVLMSVPCIFYGQGVNHSWFNERSVGTHIQLAGTLAEILGPKNFTYSSLLPNMFANNFAFNARLYAKDGVITRQSMVPEEEQKYIANTRKIAAWRVLRGNRIER